MKHISITIVSLLILLGCSNLTPNETLSKRVNENIYNYENLINEIIENDSLYSELILIRDSKQRTSSDRVGIETKLRMIEYNEFDRLLVSFMSIGADTIKMYNDLMKGIRIFERDALVIEISKTRRSTLSEKFSAYRTMEFHRIISSPLKVNRNEFYFEGEHQVYVDTIGKNLIYEVTQMKTQ